MSKSITISKKYPSNFSNDILEILDKMSLTNNQNLRILGSMGLRSQLYAGDYDGYEIVNMKGNKEEALKKIVKKFQDNIRKLIEMKNVFIGDIKSGTIEQWKIIPDEAQIKNNKVINYNSIQSKKKMDELLENNILTKDEYKEGIEKLKPKISPMELLTLKRDLRPNIIRWKPQEILKGYKYLVDGSKYTLEEAFQSPTITKMDLIGWVENNRFTDFSIIYEFRLNGKVLNKAFSDIEQSLKENIYSLYHEKNYFKMSKRIFALSKYKGYKKNLIILNKLFNSNLGIVYQVLGDVKTIENIFENYKNIPYEKIDFQIDQFKNRLSNITLPLYLKKETDIETVINQLLNLKNLASNDASMLRLLRRLKNYLEKILNFYTEKYLHYHNLLPVPNYLLP